jgi:hypothetical protein
LGPEQIDRFFRKRFNRLRLPLSRKDRQAGYDYELPTWHMEVGLTQIFDRPLRGPEFFRGGDPRQPEPWAAPTGCSCCSSDGSPRLRSD